MNSAVLDKLGRPIRDLRISVTDRCNFRCPYCMPAEIYGEKYEFLPRHDLLTFEEIERITDLMVGFGVEKVRITGGEPLLRANLPKLIAMLRAREGIKDLTLTTNGYLLNKLAASLKEAGLSRLTVSLDSLDEEVFKRMNGRNFGPESVLAGIDAAEQCGLSPIKINCVVQRGVNDHQVVDLARYFKGTGHIIRFIEFMDVGNLNGWNLSKVVSGAEILSLIADEIPIQPAEPNYYGEVANRFLYNDGSGEIGIISSVSNPFCGACSRARLTTDGRLVTCLFASGGTDLRGPMRDGATDAELRLLIQSIWERRVDRYSEERTRETPRDKRLPNGPDKQRKIEMYQIGG